MPPPAFTAPSLPHPSVSHPFRIPTTQWRIPPPVTPKRSPVSMNSVSTPDFFSTKWYHAPPLDIEQSSHHISNNDVQTDYHFVNSELGVMALVDYPSNSQTSSPALHMLEYIEKRLQQTTQYSHEPAIDLRTVLASAIHVFGAPPGFSALIVHTTSNIVRAAWVGACGFILVRDDAIVYRSYGEQVGKKALEHLLTDAPEEYLPDHQPSGGYTPNHIPSRRPPTCVDVASIQSDYLEVQDNDLVIAGSDGFFSNVSEKQVMAFVRPVQDLEDPTLAIANNTCLGSWRYDDVQFISYYLAIIATNFATATNSRPHLPFPFPPSPHLDDVTVLCASCTFVG